MMVYREFPLVLLDNVITSPLLFFARLQQECKQEFGMRNGHPINSGPVQIVVTEQAV